LKSRKNQQSTSWELPPTARQTAAITRLAMQLGIKEYIEDTPSNRREARQLIYDLRNKRELRQKNASKK